MASLSIQDRSHHEITLTLLSTGGDMTFKIPKELSVVEIERLLELQVEIDKKYAPPHPEDADVDTQRRAIQFIFAQLLVIIRHYQPEITEDYLRANITPADAYRILEFFRVYRDYAETSPKKKLTSPMQQPTS